MWRTCLLAILAAGAALAQTPAANDAKAERLKREAPPLQAAINDVVNSTVPGLGLLAPSKATYLDGYGLVVTLEVSLEPTRNPFSSAKTPAEVRTIVTQRRRELRDKLADLLRQRVAGLESIGAAESVAIIVHMLNTNPADLPDVPLQLVLTLKKQAALDLRAGRTGSSSSAVIIREF